MNDWKKFFKGKRVTVMGLGLLGRGVGDVAFLAKYCQEVIVTDLKSARELESSMTKLRKFKNILYRLGEHRLEDFENRDFILKGAGVPLDSKFVAHARTHNVPVYMSTALFAKFSPAKIIGVTGTRGKTTVTYMLYDILKLWKKHRVFLGGNIVGMSTLSMLAKARKEDVFVLELDSWQLQGFGEFKLSPEVAVFTTFMPDHLNYYKGDLKRYFADKENIFKFQKKGDILIVGDQVKGIGKKYILPKQIQLAVLGKHNAYNAGLAYAAALKFGVPKLVVKKALENFTGVPGRLQKLRTYKGIDIYNDTTSTTPHALKAALEAFHGRKIILIAGGSEKNIDLEILKKPLAECKHIILLPGAGTDRLLKENIITHYEKVSNMEEAVFKAFAFAQSGDVILLSPGFASFGLFKNEYDRGEQFCKEVARYIKK